MSDTTERNQDEGEHVPEQNGNTWVSYKDLSEKQNRERIYTLGTFIVILGVFWVLLEHHRSAGHHNWIHFTQFNEAKDKWEYRLNTSDERNKVLERRIEALERKLMGQAEAPDIMKEIGVDGFRDELARER